MPAPPLGTQASEQTLADAKAPEAESTSISSQRSPRQCDARPFLPLRLQITAHSIHTCRPARVSANSMRGRRGKRQGLMLPRRRYASERRSAAAAARGGVTLVHAIAQGRKQGFRDCNLDLGVHSLGSRNGKLATAQNLNPLALSVQQS